MSNFFLFFSFVFQREELIRACVICVNMGFHFVLVQLGTECVPNMLQARSIVSSAVHETGEYYYA